MWNSCGRSRKKKTEAFAWCDIKKAIIFCCENQKNVNHNLRPYTLTAFAFTHIGSCWYTWRYCRYFRIRFFLSSRSHFNSFVLAEHVDSKNAALIINNNTWLIFNVPDSLSLPLCFIFTHTHTYSPLTITRIMGKCKKNIWQYRRASLRNANGTIAHFSVRLFIIYSI